MTRKQYYNMAIIIRQSFDYLVELGVLPVNHFAEFKINASLLTPPKPKEAAERVFIEDEEKKLKQIAFLKDAMQWAGHRDVKTFIDHYCYSRYSDEQKKAELEKTLNL